MKSLVVLYFLHSFGFCFSENINDPYTGEISCMPLKTDHCKGLPYNSTIFPNHLGHSTQEEAGREMDQYKILFQIECSRTLKLFLCSLLFPPCTKMKKPLDPCRSLCLANKNGCEPIMQKFNYQWPSSMSCDKFKESDLCIKEPASANQPESSTAMTPSSSGLTILSCPDHLQALPNYGFHLRIGKYYMADCGVECNTYFFRDPHRRTFARFWIGLWSCLCVASTLFTVLTFLINTERFQYPERPIVFLSACYLMVSLAYVVGFILDDKVACATHKIPGQTSHPHLISQGTKFEGCIVLFMLLYFFSMASSIWWIVLTLTWYLSAKCHWAHEAIEQHSQYFHFVAWALPAAKTIGLLAWGQVDGDPLSGVCFTGFTEPWAKLGFVIIPLCLYLLIGLGFLLAGCVSMLRIRAVVRTGGTKTDKLEKLMMRIGVFSVLYVVPAVVVIACTVHEWVRHERWMRTWFLTAACRDPRNGQALMNSVPCSTILAEEIQPVGDSTRSNSPTLLTALQMKSPSPDFEVWMIKYLMTLIVGITSGIWIWSGKTLIAWHHFLHRVCCLCVCCRCCRTCGPQNSAAMLGKERHGQQQLQPDLMPPQGLSPAAQPMWTSPQEYGMGMPLLDRNSLLYPQPSYLAPGPSGWMSGPGDTPLNLNTSPVPLGVSVL